MVRKQWKAEQEAVEKRYEDSQMAIKEEIKKASEQAEKIQKDNAGRFDEIAESIKDLFDANTKAAYRQEEMAKSMKEKHDKEQAKNQREIQKMFQDF